MKREVRERREEEGDNGVQKEGMDKRRERKTEREKGRHK